MSKTVGPINLKQKGSESTEWCLLCMTLAFDIKILEISERNHFRY